LRLGLEVAIINAVASAVAMCKIILRHHYHLEVLNMKVTFQNASENHQNGGVLHLYCGNDSVIMLSGKGRQVA
jgi:hypothetical protein